MALYALTIFLGSFLLFQVQPLIGKYILPWYGGSPSVWTICMLFFQTALLAGYGYAHAATLLDRRRQGMLHLALLAASLLFLPIAPSAGLWKPSPGDSPLVKILLMLTATIGVPYLLLSASAPLLQHWFVRACPGRSPFRLYALSNAASFLALVSYPFVMEPNLAVGRQGIAWGWGYGLYVLLAGVCAAMPLFNRRLPWLGNGNAAADAAEPVITGREGTPERLSRGNAVLWLLLSACSSAVLLATTNQLCQEVAVVPFLWVVPLALYLATFVICFAGRRAYDRILWGIVFAGAVFFACRSLYLGFLVPLSVQLIHYLLVLFSCCMVCHGELVRLQPAPRHLTAYYLLIAAGGALGGAFVALAAPLLFKGFWEFPLSLTLSGLVVLIAWLRTGAFAEAPRWLPVLPLAGLVALVAFDLFYIRAFWPSTLATTRNFYGILRVIRESDAIGPKLTMIHGRVMHGTQYTDSDKRNWPTSYYNPESGVAQALRLHPRRMTGNPAHNGLRVGVIGLGTGTLALYGKPGDTFRFYEINPEVIRLAGQHFSFLGDSAARIELVPGDARIVLEDELARSGSQRFDVLVVDAFTSDAIPIHLLTRESVDLYLRHLNPDGLLVVNFTNRFLDLTPVLFAHGEHAGLRAAVISNGEDPKRGITKADWMILTRNDTFLAHPQVREKSAPPSPAGSARLLWTDSFASLWQVLRR